MTTATVALIIFVAIAAQVAVFVLVGWYRRHHEYRTLPARRETMAEIQPAAAAPAAAAWDGYREFVVLRRVMEDAAQTICSFYLVPADGQPLPSFRPGQYLTFRLPIPDPATGAIQNVIRCYSLSDRPRPDYYRVSIKRIMPPADQPDAPSGRSSNFFHDHVQEGARLEVKAPSGHFHLMEQEPLPVVLVAGGIGLTPMLSIANTMLQRGDRREVWLFYGVRNRAEHVMKEHFEALAKAHANFHLHVCYSRPGEADVQGVDYQHRGHVDIERLRLTLECKRHQYYVCGPRAMMESLVPALEAWGVDSGDIYYESFGPATLPRHDKPKVVEKKPPAQAVNITFSKSDKRLRWDPAAESLLEFAEDSGIKVDSGCRAGSCGTCQTALQSGEVEYSQDPDAEVEPGHCLLCIATPKSDLKLDA